ncbi:MAG: alpha/beta hydrolase [Herpetosiphonaceae bacterium]|nr:alpha/beta hydrolase [Herpetosiphonaceae bacterium]
MFGRSMLWLCWVITLPSVLLTLLIVLPAPIYQLWLVAVGVSEWSVWFVVLGSVGLLCGLLAVREGHTTATLPMLLSVVTIVLALLPVITAQQVANRANVQLSLRRYLIGWDGGERWLEQHDIPFTTVNHQTLKLDMYRSDPDLNPDKPLPIVIVVHGGSWSGGTKSDFAQHDRWLVGGGRVVFDIQYRLADANNRFPAAVEDVKCAIGWAKRNAATYGADPTRIALLGRSAGGQLALLAAYTPNDPALPPSCPTLDTTVRGVISLYGPTDLVWGYNHTAHPDIINGPQTLENYLGGSPTTVPATYALAAPIEHVGGTTPPTLLFHGGHDQLVGHQHAERLVAKLKGAGIPFGYTYLPWANHGFDFNFNGWGSQIAQAQIDAFLKANLK